MTFDTLDDAAEAYEELAAEMKSEVREAKAERAFVREQLTDIKAVLDLILDTLEVDEKKDEAAHG